MNPLTFIEGGMPVPRADHYITTNRMDIGDFGGFEHYKWALQEGGEHYKPLKKLKIEN
jgi:hypothetical protein